MRRAVIDIGSNSVLLLVAEQNGLAWAPILEQTAVTSLGDGVKATGTLREANIRATLDAVASMFQAARDLGAEPVAAATMAARIASNTEDFLARARAQGTPATVLSGEDEAQLGFLSVAGDPIFAAEPRISIIDPGGQSTELVTADRSPTGWNIRFRRSFPIGTLALKGGPLTPERGRAPEILAATQEIDDTIALAYLPNQAGIAVALGATGTNLVSIREGLTRWQPELVHGAWLDYEEVSKAVGWLMPLSEAERSQIPGMEPGRERTLPAGALILERFMQAIRVLGCYVSVRGWRHAMLESGWAEG